LVTSCVGTDLKKKVTERSDARRRRRGKQLLDDLKERIGCWKLKDEVLERTLWRTHFGKVCGLIRLAEL